VNSIERARSESVEKARRQAFEGAVGQESDRVARAHVGGEALHDGLGRRSGLGLCAEIVGELREVEAFADRDARSAEGREDHSGRRAERARIRALMQRSARRRATRLEDGPERTGRVPRTQSA